MSNQQTLNSTLNLRPYQRQDVDFLKQRPCGACFNQQRTGKTPTAIATFIEQGLSKILIVCPASAIYPWVEAFENWTNLKATPVAGTKLKKEEAVGTWEKGALIISYDTLKTTKKSNGFLSEITHKKPEGIILDEAHRIKERKTANAEAIFKLTQTIPYRLALTGTPANKPQDIWSILHFIDPARFSSYWRFVDLFFETYLMAGGQGQHYKEIGNIRSNKVAELQSILNELATQRKRKDVMPWLPEKEYQRILLPPTPQQTKNLQELKDYFETEHIVTQAILDRLIRYRQICLHPALLNLKGKSPKLDWIKDYLKDYPDKPTILFSKFTSFIHILSDELTSVNHRVIVGSTPVFTRNQYVKDFQAGKYNLLLLNIDAGKEALTLDRAEAVIFTDKFPPVGDIEQAEDRFVSTTQASADKAHVIYELVLKGTYDEQIYTLLERRAAAVEAINDFKKYMKGAQNGRPKI